MGKTEATAATVELTQRMEDRAHALANTIRQAQHAAEQAGEHVLAHMLRAELEQAISARDRLRALREATEKTHGQ